MLGLTGGGRHVGTAKGYNDVSETANKNRRPQKGTAKPCTLAQSRTKFMLLVFKIIPKISSCLCDRPRE